MPKKVLKSKVDNRLELPLINAIVKVQIFEIAVLWNTGEVTVIDFKPIFDYWKSTKNYSVLKKLEDISEFSKVKLVDGTLQWNNIKLAGDYLSLDPENLYENSCPLSDYLIIKKKELAQ